MYMYGRMYMKIEKYVATVGSKICVRDPLIIKSLLVLKISEGFRADWSASKLLRNWLDSFTTVFKCDRIITDSFLSWLAGSVTYHECILYSHTA